MRKLALMLSLAALVLISTASLSQAKPKLEQLPLGKKVPDFTLTGIDGKQYKLSSLCKGGKVVVLEWYNPGCPAVKKYRKDATFMNDTWAKMDKKKVAWLSINSNAAGKEGTGVQVNKDAAKEFGMTTPVLLDESGAAGKAFGASCTPTVFVVDAKQMLVYRGAPDEATALDKQPKGTNYISAAVEAALKGKKPAVAETKPFG